MARRSRATAQKPTASLKMLGGDEIVQLSIRPSPWYIVFSSFKLVLAMGLLAAGIAIATRGWYSSAAAVAIVVVVLVGLSGVLGATLQWASRTYVLTNRRVLSFRGVFSVDVDECALPQIATARIQRAWYQRQARVGSIHLTPTSQDKPAIVWEHVARPGRGARDLGARDSEVQDLIIGRARPHNVTIHTFSSMT